MTPTVSLRVRTTDSSGATFEKAIVLPVMAPPTITRQPDPRRVFAGDPVVFAAEATGLKPLAFQWKKYDANLAGANSRILDRGGADPSQEGNYSATVPNGDGTAASVAAGLMVGRLSTFPKFAPTTSQCARTSKKFSFTKARFSCGSMNWRRRLRRIIATRNSRSSRC